MCIRTNNITPMTLPKPTSKIGAILLALDYPPCPARKFPRKPYNKFLLNKLVRSRWWILASLYFCEFMDLVSVSVYKHAKEELGQYLAILTLHLDNNLYTWSITYIYYTVYIEISFVMAQQDLGRTTAPAIYAIDLILLLCCRILKKIIVTILLFHIFNKVLDLASVFFVFQLLLLMRQILLPP